jgi:hypothetical protein
MRSNAALRDYLFKCPDHRLFFREALVLTQFGSTDTRQSMVSECHNVVEATTRKGAVDDCHELTDRLLGVHGLCQYRTLGDPGCDSFLALP